MSFADYVESLRQGDTPDVELFEQRQRSTHDDSPSRSESKVARPPKKSPRQPSESPRTKLALQGIEKLHTAPALPKPRPSSTSRPVPTPPGQRILGFDGALTSRSLGATPGPDLPKPFQAAPQTARSHSRGLPRASSPRAASRAELPTCVSRNARGGLSYTMTPRQIIGSRKSSHLDSTRGGDSPAQGGTPGRALKPPAAPATGSPSVKSGRSQQTLKSDHYTPRSDLGKLVQQGQIESSARRKAAPFCEDTWGQAHAQNAGGSADMLTAAKMSKATKQAYLDRMLSMDDVLSTVSNQELRKGYRRAWRTDVGSMDLENIGQELLGSSAPEKFEALPPVCTSSTQATEQLNALNDRLNVMPATALRGLLTSHCDQQSMLDARRLRAAFQGLNMEPCEELLASLLGGSKQASVSQLVQKMNNQRFRQDYHPPLANSGLALPYGVPIDTIEAMTQLHAELSSRWGSLFEAFEMADSDHNGRLSLPEFSSAMVKVFPQVFLSKDELKKMFIECDVNFSGYISYDEFKKKFGQGEFLVPQFARIRSQRGSADNRMLHWIANPQGSNSFRSFEITDKEGSKRYHCKPCHMYYLPKCFSQQAIKSNTHVCSACWKAIETDRVPGRHCRKLPYEEWPLQPPSDKGRKEWKSGPWTCTSGSDGPRPPWVADEPACDRFRRSSSSYGSSCQEAL